MDVRGARANHSRVVVLSRDPTLGLRLTDACAPSVEVVRVASGYEAGAEILAAPTAVMVVDFHALSRGDTGLLAVARRMEVELFGVGPLPGRMSAEDLSRLRLLALAELPEAIAERTAPVEEPAPPAEPPSAAPEPVSPPPAEPKKPRRRKRKAKRPKPPPAEPQPAPTPTPPADEEPTPPAEPHPTEPARETPAAPQKPGDLLTPEELAALLGDES